MNTSKLYYLMKTRDGKIFEENFENDNFILARGWITVQGSPKNTAAQFVEGIRSYDCTLTSRPIIKETFTTETKSTDQWMVSFWMFDDTSNTTGPGPFVKIKLDDGKFVQFGIRNAVSTTNYCGNPTLGDTKWNEENFAATSANRVNGWNKVSIIHLPLNGFSIVLNGTLVLSITWSDFSSRTLSDLYVCSCSTSDVTTSFGYFDEVLVTKNSHLNIEYETDQDAPTVGFYRSDWTFSNSNPLVMYDKQSVGAESMHVLIGDANGRIQYFSPTLEVYPGDTYRVEYIDYGRKVRTRNPTPKTLGTRSETDGGISETFTFGQKNTVQWVIESLEGVDWESQARTWWEYARKGYPFGLDVISGVMAFGVISTAAQAGELTVSLLGGIGTHATDDFIVGEWYVIRDAFNTYQQRYKLASKNNTSLTFSEYLRTDVSQYNYIHHAEMYPFLEIGNNQFGFTLTVPTHERYTWSQTAQEYNNG